MKREKRREKAVKCSEPCLWIFKQIFFHRADTRGVLNYENNLERVLNTSSRFLRKKEKDKDKVRESERASERGREEEGRDYLHKGN